MQLLLHLRRWDQTEVILGLLGDRFVDPDEVDGPLLDLRGLWCLPGLADCHAHLSADSLDDRHRPSEYSAIRRRAFAQLEAGVFLLFDKGWSDEAVLRLLDEPPPERPALLAAGRIISGPQGYFEGFAVETDEAGLVEAVAAANVSGGWVKLIGDWPQKGRGPVINFGEAALAAAVQVVHGAGGRVAIHTMAPETPGMAVRAGVDSIEHGLFLSEDDLEVLGPRRGAWVPTVVNVESVAGSMTAGSTGARILGKGLDNVRRLLPRAEELGVTVLCGTDLGLPHGAVSAEAGRLHQFGLSGEATVEAVGPAAYRYSGRRFLEVGAEADLVLFDEPPSGDVKVLGRPTAGMRAGRICFDRSGVFET